MNFELRASVPLCLCVEIKYGAINLFRTFETGPSEGCKPNAFSPVSLAHQLPELSCSLDCLVFSYSS